MTKRIQSLRPRPDLAEPAPPSDNILTQPREAGFNQDAIQKWAVPVLLVLLAVLTIWIGWTVTQFVGNELNPPADLTPIVTAQASDIEADRVNQLESIYTRPADFPAKLVDWAKLTRAEELTLTGLQGLVGSADNDAVARLFEQLRQSLGLYDELLAGGTDVRVRRRALMGRALAFEGLAEPQKALTAYADLIEEDADGPLGRQARARAEAIGYEKQPGEWWIKESVLAFYERWKRPATIPPLEGSLPGLKVDTSFRAENTPPAPPSQDPMSGLGLPPELTLPGTTPDGAPASGPAAEGMLPGSSPLSIPAAREPLAPGLDLPAAAPTPGAQEIAPTGPPPGDASPAETPSSDPPPAEAPSGTTPPADATPAGPAADGK